MICRRHDFFSTHSFAMTFFWKNAFAQYFFLPPELCMIFFCVDGVEK